MNGRVCLIELRCKARSLVVHSSERIRSSCSINRRRYSSEGLVTYRTNRNLSILTSFGYLHVIKDLKQTD
jgi:hypothetical protein